MPGEIVKKGILYKKKENLKKWCARYFVLYEDGPLIGYKVNTELGSRKDMVIGQQLNTFNVKHSKIIKTDRPKPFAFIVRGLKSPNVVERSFYAESETEREGWVNSMENVAKNLETGQKNKENTDKKKVELQDFEFLKVIGNGTFGKVVLCTEKKTKNIYAMKILKKDRILRGGNVSHRHTLTENQVMQKINHPFLISLKYSFTTKDRLCFVMEYANGGELYFHRYTRKIAFGIDMTKFYGAEIVSAIGYLHQNGIIYRDLKLENLLLDKHGHVKLVDFGICKQELNPDLRTETICGSPEYLAPEEIKNEPYGFPVDWWALGVVMYEMFYGKHPFGDDFQDVTSDYILHNEVYIHRCVSPVVRDLLKSLLMKDPTKRLGSGSTDAKEIKKHKFFATIDWVLLEKKKLSPPFIPEINSETDTRYFDENFTQKPVELTPPPQRSRVTSRNQEKIDQLNFDGFSYKSVSLA